LPLLCCTCLICLLLARAVLTACRAAPLTHLHAALILLQVAADPHGRTVMVELAGTAAKEAARGVSAALADRFRMEWLLLAALAMMLLAWLAQRMLGVLLG
jgi:hypothetical protein